MITDGTLSSLNAVLKKLYSDSYVFDGISCAFKEAGHKGFAAFASYEARERWHYGRKIKYYIEKFGKKPVLPALPEPSTTFNNPADAVNIMVSSDKSTVSMLYNGTKAAAGAGDHYAVKCMNKIYGKMLHEHMETSNVMKQLQAVSGTPGDVLMLDEHLYHEYHDKHMKYRHDHDHEHYKE